MYLDRYSKSTSNNYIITAKSPNKRPFNRRFKKRLSLFFHGIFSVGLPVVAVVFISVLGFQASNTEVNFNTSRSALASEIPLSNNKSVEGVVESSQEAVAIQPAVQKLEIPLIKQEYRLSCEAASLQMALKYYNIEVTQDQLLGQLGVDGARQPVKVGANYVWGDPDKAFVGDVKGWFTGPNPEGVESLEYATGWGVNNGPIADLAKQYRPGSYEVDGASVSDIVKALDEQKPVLFWHRRDDAIPDILKIYTTSGVQKNFFQMHVAVVIGYQVDESGKLTFTINDPYFETYQASEQDFVRRWAVHNKEIVVVS